LDKTDLTQVERTLNEVESPGQLSKVAPFDIDSLSAPSTPSSPQHVSPSTGPWSKELLAQAGKLKEKDNASRRTIRMQNQKKGFRKSTCPDKNCIGCSAEPPILSPTVIKNLGAEFCKVEPSKLTEENLKKKKKLPPPGGKKQVVKKPAPNDDDKDKQAKKKSKK
jgi:hypothetical protein